jgi:endonuclease/exonuclease/phosphatase family metal-dependent hydrolase
MKKSLFIIVTILVLLSGCKSITVMSYNIHAMRGMDKVVDVDRIAKVIKDQTPDVVGLQEVDQFTERSGKIDAIKILAEKTEMYGVFMATFDYQGGEFGDAMLSKYPIIDQKLYRLPSRDNYEPRLMMMISCVVENGDTIHFYNTHLDHHRQDSDRPIQVEAIKKIIETDNAKIILMGDFNCEPGSESLNTIQSVLTRCPSDVLTYSTNEPIWTIDHIFYTEDRGIRFQEFKVIPEEMASDHFPIVAKFRIK